MKKALKKIRNKIDVPRLNLMMIVMLIAIVLFPLVAPIVPAVYEKPIIKNQDTIYSGRPLAYKISGCRNVGDNVLTTITRSLVPVDDINKKTIVLNTDVIAGDKGCRTEDRNLVLPYDIEDGSYQLVITGVYSVIPLRKPISVSSRSEPFDIYQTSAGQRLEDLINANSELQLKLIELQVSPGSDGTSTTTTTTELKETQQN